MHNQEIMMERDMLRMENDRLRQRLQEAEGMIGQLLLENQRFQTQRNGNYNNNSNSSSVTRYHKNVSGSPSPKLELARTASCSTDWDCDDSYSTEDCPFFGASGWSGGSSITGGCADAWFFVSLSFFSLSLFLFVGVFE